LFETEKEAHYFMV